MVLVACKPMNSIVLVGLLLMAIHFLQASRKRATLRGTEESMTTTSEFITALFYEVDEQMGAVPKHPEAHLWPSEVVTLGLLHALKGGGNRAFYRWLTRDYRALFPRLPERTRLFRLFRTHQDWTRAFLAAPTVLGVIDTYGIELIHPMREGRSPQQIGRKGLSNHRWIVGGKLLSLSRLNHWLPRGQAHPEVVQGTAEFHHQITDALLPQAHPVFHDATALDTTVDVLDP